MVKGVILEQCPSKNNVRYLIPICFMLIYLVTLHIKTKDPVTRH
jgi:hypothetical protein